MLLAAGIWDKWTDSESGKVIFSFAILTDEPTPFILEVGHDRQPVFLDDKNANIWLDYKTLPAEEAYNFLKNNQEKVDYIVVNQRALKMNNNYDLFNDQDS